MNRQLSALLAILVIGIAAVIWFRTNNSSDRSPAGAPPNLVLVTGGATQYWQVIANGARTAAEDLGAHLEVLMPEQDEDVDGQMKLLFNIDTQKVDGVAISPLDAEQQTHLINRLSQNAVVVTFDSDAPLSTRMSYIGASNWAAGKQCAQLVKEAIPSGGKVAVLLANLTKVNTQERKRGFEETLAQETHNGEASPPKFEIVDWLIDEGDHEVCKQQLSQLLDENQDLACVVGMNSYHGPILLEVLKERGRLDDIKLVTFDNEKETLQGIEDGHIYATVAQDPYHYGYEAVRILTSYHMRGEHQLPLPGSQSTITISTQAVKKGGLESFRKQLEERSNDAPPLAKPTTA